MESLQYSRIERRGLTKQKAKSNCTQLCAKAYGIIYSDWSIFMSVTSARVSDYVIDVTV